MMGPGGEQEGDTSSPGGDYLHLSTSELRAVVDSTPTAIVIVDSNGTISLVNQQTEALFGYSRSELLGEPVELLVPHRFRTGHPQLRQAYVGAPSARAMGAGRDLFGLRQDGTEFPIEIGLNPIHTADGLCVVSAIVDITERKRLEERFRATVESAPTAMVMIDQVGSMVLVNRETERLFGYAASELLGQKVEVLVPDRLRANHPRLRTQYFAKANARPMGAGRDLFGVRKNGEEFPIEIGLNPLERDQGAFVLAAIIDLTERKRDEEKLRHANEELERSNLELQQFAYIASHDLQAPLRSISGFLQLLRESYADQLDEQALDWISRVVSSTTHMQTLIRDLLEYSRVDSRARPFSDTPLSDVVDAAINLLDSSIQDSQGTVKIGKLPSINGDHSQLVQLFQNLIGNALKYHGNAPPAVEIMADEHKEYWQLAVKDKGIGIEPKHQAKIFEVFRRLHSQTEIPGNGIGLAICRRIVSRHGGRIWVESEKDQGSTFSFTLPKNRDQSC